MERVSPNEARIVVGNVAVNTHSSVVHCYETQMAIDKNESQFYYWKIHMKIVDHCASWKYQNDENGWWFSIGEKHYFYCI